jgi:hypothetical protein
VGWVKRETKPEKQTATLRGMRTASLFPARRNRPFLQWWVLSDMNVSLRFVSAQSFQRSRVLSYELFARNINHHLTHVTA